MQARGPSIGHPALFVLLISLSQAQALSDTDIVLISLSSFFAIAVLVLAICVCCRKSKKESAVSAKPPAEEPPPEEGSMVSRAAGVVGSAVGKVGKVGGGAMDTILDKMERNVGVVQEEDTSRSAVAAPGHIMRAAPVQARPGVRR